MEKSLVLDIVLVVFLLLFSFIGSNTGFIRSLFRLIRLLIAYFGAAFIAKILSPIVSAMFLFSGVQHKLSAATGDLTSNVFSSVTGGLEHLGNGITQAASTLSQLAQNAGLPKVLAESLAVKFSAATPNAGESLLDVATRIVSDNIAYIVVFLLTFVIILIVVSFFTSWLVGLIRFIVPRFLDRFLGFFFGLLVGGLWVFLFFQFSKNTIPSLFQTGALFSSDVMKDTYLVSYFLNTDFLSVMPKIFNTYLFQDVS